MIYEIDLTANLLIQNVLHMSGSMFYRAFIDQLIQGFVPCCI
jgi:hypothetical protein